MNKLTRDLKQGPAREAVIALGTAPLPIATKAFLFVELLHAVKTSGQSDVPRIDPIFATASRTATPQQRVTLEALRRKVDAIIQRSVTPAFHRPYQVAALFALLVLPLLGLRLLFVPRREIGPPEAAAV